MEGCNDKEEVVGIYVRSGEEILKAMKDALASANYPRLKSKKCFVRKLQQKGIYGSQKAVVLCIFTMNGSEIENQWFVFQKSMFCAFFCESTSNIILKRKKWLKRLVDHGTNILSNRIIIQFFVIILCLHKIGL